MDERLIRAKTDRIRQLATRQVWPIQQWEARTADHLAPGEYRYDGDWGTITGETSWPATKTVFLRTRIAVPALTSNDPIFLQFDASGLEGLLSIDGQPFAGIDVNHPRVLVPPGRELLIEAEFMCLGQALSHPEMLRERATLRGASFVQIDEATEALYFDLWFAWDAGKQAHDERRRQRLSAALENALLAIDLTAPMAQFDEDVRAARAILRDEVAAIAPDPEAGRVFLTGHSHIDTAWLWPLRETVRKCGRTFSTACRLLERYPDYHFSCSQPQLYAYTRQYFPDLYEQIKGWVKAGRWECTSGMWVESDCNVPSGEALIRQFLYGIRLFRDEFGVKPTTCWLPDVFGYPASMPQILRGCGLENFYTNKLHWQARNPFPAHLFWWRGVDGTRILAHIPRLKNYYNGWPNPEELNIAWDNFSQKAVYPETLFPFGFGDGGGGPTEPMLEFAARATNFPGVPVARQGLEEHYFNEVHASAAAATLPEWSGELYLETHRGTYTTQSAIKRANRKNELLLRDAEIFGTLANLNGATVDISRLLPVWENLLLLQFHDILPGSSIGEVYREAAVDHAVTATTAQSVRDTALNALAGNAQPGAMALIAFNSLSWARGDAVTAEIQEVAEPIELAQPNGAVTPAQVIGHSNGKAQIVFVPDATPALGYTTLHARQAQKTATSSLSVTEHVIENQFFVIELNDEGEITRLLDKRCDREVIPTGQRANVLQLFQDGPEREAAWNVHATLTKRAYAWDARTTVQVVEHGPVRATLRITHYYRDSVIEQDMIVYDRVARIDFVTHADWQARQVMLKVAFPVEVMSPQATYEIQFGAVERPTHHNTTWDSEKFEVCAHRWADLSEAGYGVSLLNDSRYGYDVYGNTLRLSLLRGAEWPDPDADRGQHEFTYALLPHLKGWGDAEVVRRAAELNSPVTCIATSSDAGARSFIQVDGSAILDTLKPAEDGQGVIIRLYEPHGGRGRVRVTLPQAWRHASECNMVEEPVASGTCAIVDSVLEFGIKPFEVKTFRLS